LALVLAPFVRVTGVVTRPRGEKTIDGNEVLCRASVPNAESWERRRRFLSC